MATSLFTQLISNFKGDALGTVASAIGETPARTENALGAVLPALLTGLAGKTSTPGQAADLLDVITGSGVDLEKLADAASAFKDPAGTTALGKTGQVLMESIFGGRAGSLADWVASSSGISRPSASSLLNLALPIVLGLISRHLKSAGGSASSLMTLLREQRSLLRDMPGLAAALNPDGGPIESSEKEGAPSVNAPDSVHAAPVLHDPVPTSRRAWLWAVALLILIPLFTFLTTRGDGPTHIARTKTVSEPAVRGAIPDPATPVGTSGVSSAILAKSGSYRIQFQPGSSRITLASEEALRDVAAVLNANVGARADINGYTDNAGDAGANRRLSETRATAMKNELVRLGVDRSRINARGYGEEGPVADNTTAEGRQRNNRVEIRVTTR